MAPTTKIPARDFIWEINAGSVSVPDWEAIGGLNSWSHSPQSNDADTTTFDEGGRLSHFKASRGDQFTLSGRYKEDVSDGTRDAGQAACETLGSQVGPESVAQFRVTSPGGTVKTFAGSATVTVGGGGNDDPTSWECALVVDGPITSSTAGALPGAPTAVAGSTDDEFSIITWTDSGTGAPFDRYEIAALVTGVEVDRIAVTTPEVGYFAELTNGTGYTFRVRARNAAGWGPWSAASSPVTPAGE